MFVCRFLHHQQLTTWSQKGLPLLWRFVNGVLGLVVVYEPRSDGQRDEQVGAKLRNHYINQVEPLTDNLNLQLRALSLERKTELP